MANFRNQDHPRTFGVNMTSQESEKALYAKAYAASDKNLMAQSKLSETEKRALENPLETEPKVTLTDKDMSLLASRNFETLQKMMDGQSNDLAMRR